MVSSLVILVRETSLEIPIRWAIGNTFNVPSAIFYSIIQSGIQQAQKSLSRTVTTGTCPIILQSVYDYLTGFCFPRAEVCSYLTVTHLQLPLKGKENFVIFDDAHVNGYTIKRSWRNLAAACKKAALRNPYHWIAQIKFLFANRYNDWFRGVLVIYMSTFTKVVVVSCCICAMNPAVVSMLLWVRQGIANNYHCRIAMHIRQSEMFTFQRHMQLTVVEVLNDSHDCDCDIFSLSTKRIYK